MVEVIRKRKRRQKRGLQWTESQKAVAELYRQGKTFDEVVAAGYTKTMAHRVMVALEKGQKPKDFDETPPRPPGGEVAKKPQTAARKEPETPAGPPASAFQTKYHLDTSEPVTVGSIQVLPEDWRITQYGLFLVLDTFYQTKEEIGYDGTIGRFIVDVFRLYRMIMQYGISPEVGPPLITQSPKEVASNGHDGRGEEADRGERVCEEGSSVDH